MERKPGLDTGVGRESCLKACREVGFGEVARRERLPTGRAALEKAGVTPTARQERFMQAEADEVLFGGAAGGGKSMAQLMDAFVYALDRAGSRQLILRRSYPELEKSLIRAALAWFPREVYRYNVAKHSMEFLNGSLLDFGYCEGDNDVYRYQSVEYDVIRFDELTHFSQWVYLYLMSRLRGVGDFPRQVKSSTNPGGVGHSWVKRRFVDPAPAQKVFVREGGSRVFLPSVLADNPHLEKADPGYGKRLLNLPERERRALLHGDWNISGGQYFPEFSRKAHVCGAFAVPEHWRVYRALDYGLDMLACYWIALDDGGRAYVFREVFEAGLVISAAAGRICAAGAETVYATFAPPDLWNRRQETGRSAADIFVQNGVPLTKVDNQRVQEWLDLKEYLKVPEGGGEPVLQVFEGCEKLIESMLALPAGAGNPNDAATEPHEYTHAPDALRYFAAGRPCPAGRQRQREEEDSYARQVAALLGF